ncbi:AraC family transcriptional regulator [Oceanimonas sp. AH20CE76]|uniref:helix-turn-helix transcriptional regulator n=1 Tax=Oceanimonas sp. AH20CE76 TaxID=2977120 RepID=UPI0031FE9AF5
MLLEQLDALPQAPLDLPEPKDCRAVRLAQWLKEHPEDRTPLTVLAPKFGGSVKTLERLFTAETGMSFGGWRIRLRMMMALEQLAHGESVANVAHAVGYESPSSFIAAFRSAFGTTPSRYFDV